MSLLIIDDDPRNIFALSAVLRARNYTCITAPGFTEALELLEKDATVQAILLDMMMPGIDGYEALTILKQHEQYKYIPVVAITAQAMAGDREKCLSAGADEYISKPVDIDALVQFLQTLN